MSLVDTRIAGGRMTITLAHAERRNALSEALMAELFDAITVADESAAVRYVVLTNEGGVFCAGADLGQWSGASAGPAAALTELLHRIRTSPKPWVGRIAGHAIGGGLGLAASLDVSVAVDTARFGFSEVRLGTAPAIISVVCLPKMRRADAAAAMLRGNRFGAGEAVRLGLINEVCPVERLDEVVDGIGADLLLGGPEALAATKRLLHTVPDLPADEARSWASSLARDLFASDEAQAGMAAFLDKRPAPWVEDRPGL